MYETWEEKDLAAQLEIMAHLEDQQADTIRKCTTASQMWKDLQSEFEPKTDGNQVMTLNSLVTLRMENEDEMLTFINTWKRKLDDCLTSGVEITQKLQRLLLLGALPSSWSTFVTTQNSNQNATLTDLINCIKQEEAMRKARHQETTYNPTAMIAYRNRQHHQSYKPKSFFERPHTQQGGMRFSKVTCTYCHKIGHTKNECRNRFIKGKQEYQEYKPRMQAHMVEYGEVDEENMHEDGYDDLLQAFSAEALNIGISTEQKEDNLWYFDTGATHHLTNNKDWLSNYNSLQTPITVRFGNNGVKQALGKGEISFKLQADNIFSIGNVYYVPGITKNLLSVGQAIENGASIEFKRDYAQIKYMLPNGQEIKHNCQRLEKGLYPIQCTPIKQHIETNYVEKIDHNILWHHRLGHTNIQTIKTLQSNNMVIGLPKEHFSAIELCEGCIFGKMSQHPFPIRQSKSEYLLQLVHSDICGPFPTTSITGSKYFISFIDDYSSFTVLTFLKSKNQALQAFKNYVTLAENITKETVQQLQTDGGGEYNSNAFKEYFQAKGIKHRKTTPHTPQQNGISERKNRSLLNAARSMMNVAKLEPKFWEEAIATTCHLQNRVHHKSTGIKTPHELWYGQKPYIKDLKVFGCPAYAYRSNNQKNKLDNRANKTIFVGYGDAHGYKAYRLYDANNNKFTFSRSVIFDESAILQQLQDNIPKQCTQENGWKRISQQSESLTNNNSDEDAQNTTNTDRQPFPNAAKLLPTNLQLLTNQENLPESASSLELKSNTIAAETRARAEDAAQKITSTATATSRPLQTYESKVSSTRQPENPANSGATSDCSTENRTVNRSVNRTSYNHLRKSSEIILPSRHHMPEPTSLESPDSSYSPSHPRQNNTKPNPHALGSTAKPEIVAHSLTNNSYSL